MVPILQLGACFSEDDVRGLIGDGVGLVVNATEIALNNLIDQQLGES